jgi:hypothetical protein
MSAGLSCPYCELALGVSNLSIDHKEGRGSDLHPVCIGCNLLKNIMIHADFLLVKEALGVERLRLYGTRIREQIRARTRLAA